MTRLNLWLRRRPSAATGIERNAPSALTVVERIDAGSEGGAIALPVPAADRAGDEATTSAAHSAPAPQLAGRVQSASMWVAVTYVGEQVLRLGGNLVLARLLFPEAFGVMLLLNTLMLGLELLSDLGSSALIVQSKRSDPRFLNTVWTVQILRGLLMWLILCAASAPLAAFYRQPLLASALPVMGLGIVLAGFDSTARHVMHRTLELRRLSLMTLFSAALGLSVSLTWAWWSPSVWALIGGTLCWSVSMLVLSHTILPQHRHRLAWEPAAVGELWQFGRWILLSTAFYFLATRCSTLLMGRFLDPAMLGVASFALALAGMPSAAINQLASVVLFPVLSEHKRCNYAEFARAFHSSRELILSASRICVLSLLLLSPPFFAWLYPADYRAAIWMTQLLGLHVWVTLLCTAPDRALLADGDGRSLMLSRAATFVGTVACCWAGFHWHGLRGFLLGMAGGTLAGYFVVVTALWRKQGLALLARDAAASLTLGLLAALSLVSARLLTDFSGMSPALAALLVAVVVLPWPAATCLQQTWSLWNRGKSPAAAHRHVSAPRLVEE